MPAVVYLQLQLERRHVALRRKQQLLGVPGAVFELGHGLHQAHAGAALGLVVTLCTDGESRGGRRGMGGQGRGGGGGVGEWGYLQLADARRVNVT